MFIPKYFILFGAIMKGIVFLISFADSLLLAYKNIDFYILRLDNSFILAIFFWIA